MWSAFCPPQLLNRLAYRPPQTYAAGVATLDHRLLLARGFAHRAIAMISDHEPRRANDIWIGIYDDLFFCHVQ